MTERVRPTSSARFLAPCPTCQVRQAAPPPETPRPSWAPFCSERCKLIDLARWLGGDHAIAGEPAYVDEH